MPTSYTNLLGLALPVTGELAGTWGDEVNNYITQYLDGAVAGTQTISGSQTAVTLSKTTNASLAQAGSGSTGSSQYQVINCTGNPASALTVTVPSASKVYLVLNNTSTNQTVTVKGAATTGVTVAAARCALIAWNGTDFELVATDDASKMNGVLAAVNGGTGQSSYTTGDILYASSSTALAKLADVATGNALISGGVGVAPSYGKIGLTTHVSGTLPVANGGTNATATPTAGTIAYGTGSAYAFNTAGTSGQPLLSGGSGAPTFGTLSVGAGGTGLTSTPANGALDIGNGSGFTRATLTAGSGVSISNGAGSITIAATGSGGTVTGVTATSPVASSGGTAPVISLNSAYGDTLNPYASKTANFVLAAPNGIAGVPTFRAIVAADIPTLNQNTTGTASNVTGIVAAVNGGTGQSSYAVGDLLFASTTTALSKLADVATGNALISGGVGVAPSYGKIGLTTHVSGTLPIANGGTNVTTTPSNGQLLIGNGTGYTVANLTAGSNVTITNSAGGITIAASAGSTLLGQTDSASPFETALGYQAGNANTGTHNTFIGYQSGLTNVGASNNTAVGSRSLEKTTTGGNNNNAFGYGALLSNTTGTANNAFGTGALSSNTTGNNNVAVGDNALGANTIGTNNTAVGHQALDANTAGDRNTAIGVSALGANTTGTDNVAVGRNALLVSTIGSQNTAVGVSTLEANTTGNDNVAVGRDALRANTVGRNNVAVGSFALDSNTTGIENTAVGYQAASNVTTASDNTALGYNSLFSTTTGQFNTALGAYALLVNSTASNNTAVGYYALYANTTGANNTAVGYQALDANTIGYQNVAVGSDALGANTTGRDNIAVGYNALFTNTVGYDITAVGSNALYANTTGDSNVAVGRNALGANTTGSRNSGLGWFALGANTTGTDNTAVGNESGDKITTGNYNVTIGVGAASSGTNDLTTGSNNIIIGYNAAASSATVSNEVTIGNTSITSTRLRGMVELNAAMFEAATVSATAATGTINFDARSQSVLYYTTNASGNWTLNIRAASGVSLDSVMSTGESMTVAFLVTNGGTAYYQTALQVDGSAITPKWQGGTAPTAGNASSIDVYVITIIKTGAATFTALENQTKFA